MGVHPGTTLIFFVRKPARIALPRTLGRYGPPASHPHRTQHRQRSWRSLRSACVPVGSQVNHDLEHMTVFSILHFIALALGALCAVILVAGLGELLLVSLGALLPPRRLRRSASRKIR